MKMSYKDMVDIIKKKIVHPDIFDDFYSEVSSYSMKNFYCDDKYIVGKNGKDGIFIEHDDDKIILNGTKWNKANRFSLEVFFDGDDVIYKKQEVTDIHYMDDKNIVEVTKKSEIKEFKDLVLVHDVKVSSNTPTELNRYISFYEEDSYFNDNVCIQKRVRYDENDYGFNQASYCISHNYLKEKYSKTPSESNYNIIGFNGITEEEFNNLKREFINKSKVLRKDM